MPGGYTPLTCSAATNRLPAVLGALLTLKYSDAAFVGTLAPGRRNCHHIPFYIEQKVA